MKTDIHVTEAEETAERKVSRAAKGLTRGTRAFKAEREDISTTDPGKTRYLHVKEG